MSSALSILYLHKSRLNVDYLLTLLSFLVETEERLRDTTTVAGEMPWLDDHTGAVFHQNVARVAGPSAWIWVDMKTGSVSSADWARSQQ